MDNTDQDLYRQNEVDETMNHEIRLALRAVGCTCEAVIFITEDGSFACNDCGLAVGL